MTRSRYPTRWRRRRWLRRLLIGVVAAPVISVAGLWLTQGWWLPALIEPGVERLTGLSSTSQSIRLRWDGGVAIRRLELRASGRTGAPTVAVSRIDASFSWSALARGRLELRDITFVKPVVRIGVDSPVAPDAVKPVRPQDPSLQRRLLDALPQIEIVDGAIAFTQHARGANSDDEEIIFSLSADGGLQRRSPDSALYDLNLTQSGDGDPVRLTGWVDLSKRTARLTARDIGLTHWIDLTTIPKDASLWRSIVSAGRVKTVELTYSAEAGVSSSLEIKDVQFSVPTHGVRAQGSGVDRLNFQGVSGVVTATGQSLSAHFNGLIEGLPTTVTLSASALSMTAPVEIELRGGPFLIGQEWKPLTLAPADVQEILTDFSSPTAEVQARVVLSRTEASAAVDEGFAVSGEVDLQHGAATFVDFPYPLSEMTGVVRFDDQSIRIEGLTGVGPTGAIVRADGVVTPVADSVGLELDLQGHDVPIDDTLLNALDEEDRSLVASILDRTQAAKLQAQGVFATNQQKADARVAIARLDESRAKASQAGDTDQAASLRGAIATSHNIATRPTFNLGGAASFTAHISRPPGPIENRRITVNLRMDRAGIIDEDFPYPIIVAPLVARIADGGFAITRAPFTGLTGARGVITGAIRSDDLGERPDLTIHFDELPIDETLFTVLDFLESPRDRLIAARSASQRDRASHAPPTLAETLRRLGASGMVAGEARVESDENGAVRWSVFAPLVGLTLHPQDLSDDAAGPDSFAGALTVSPEGWRIEDGASRFGQSLINFSIDAPFEAGEPTRVAFASEALELSTPVESVLQALQSDAAASLVELRKKYDPQGEIAAHGVATLSTGAFRSHIELTPMGGLSIASKDGRSGLAPRAGRVLIDDGVVTIEGAEVELIDNNGVSQGAVNVDMPLPDASGETRLRISATNLAFEAPVVRSIVEQAQPAVSPRLASSSPAGRFDAALTVVRGVDSAWRIEQGELMPRSLRFTVDQQRLVFDSIAGVITLGPAGGEAQSLTLRSARFSATIDGSWFAGDTPGVDLRFVAQGDRLSDDLIAIMPTDVRDALRGVNLKIEHGFAISSGKLAINAPVEGADVGDGFRDGVRFGADISFDNASADLGVHLEHMTGGATINVTRAPSVRATTLDVSLAIGRLKAEGLTMRDVQASVRSMPDRARTLRVELLGKTHGGRVSGDGAIHFADGSTAGGSAGAPAWTDGYELTLQAAGVDLAGVLNDAGADDAGADSTADSTADAAADAAGGDDDAGAQRGAGQRGRLDASVTLVGELSSSAGPHGAGALRLVGGQYAKLPLVMSVLELGNLIPPLGERLDYARADFTIAGDSMTFDRLLAVSPSMALIGDGSMKLATGALDLRFGVSGNRRLPIFSSMFDVLRNELMTTRVEGTLRDPEFRLEPLSGTRRFFIRLFGGK